MNPTLEARAANFPRFLEERMPVLVEFAEALGGAEPHRILKEPNLFLPGISEWLTHQAIAPEDRPWLVTRLGYFVGELFVTQFSGAWLLNETSGSRYFGRYVVGQFAAFSNQNAQFDPFDVAMEAISNQSVSLESLCSEVSNALRAA
ncbi:hypothetical protein [Viridibacterium curvum]|uniref:Uncharacterized protein n=1 Tax=Viridibacterium curvum TaxID=1101404 RepID=A0ABP9R8G3_9RHOO